MISLIQQRIYSNDKVSQCNGMNALFQDMYLDLKFKEQYLKKVPDMSRQQVKVSRPRPKLSCIIQYILWHQSEYFERIIESDYDTQGVSTQVLQVQMNNHMSVKWIVDRESIARDKKLKPYIHIIYMYNTYYFK